MFFIHYHDDLKRTILFDNDDSIEDENHELKCGFEAAAANDNHFNHHVIDKRSTPKKIHGVYQQNTQTRFVELVIVNDHKLVSFFFIYLKLKFIFLLIYNYLLVLGL